MLLLYYYYDKVCRKEISLLYYDKVCIKEILLLYYEKVCRKEISLLQSLARAKGSGKINLFDMTEIHFYWVKEFSLKYFANGSLRSPYFARA